MEDHVTQMCSNLFDKNGNKIDVNIVATVYLSAFEISAYLKKCTNYLSADIKLVAKYINDLPGYDCSRKEISYYKRKIERCDWDFSTPTKKMEPPMQKKANSSSFAGRRSSRHAQIFMYPTYIVVHFICIRRVQGFFNANGGCMVFCPFGLCIPGLIRNFQADHEPCCFDKQTPHCSRFSTEKNFSRCAN